MRFLRGFRAHREWAFAVFIAAVVMLAPLAALAQDSGTSVDECSSGIVDSDTGVEQTVCLSGDASEVDAYVEVDNWGGGNYYDSADEVGASGYVSGPGVSTYMDDQCCSSGETAWGSIVPQVNQWYYLDGYYDEDVCDEYWNCNWQYGNYGLSVAVEVTSAPAPSMSLSGSDNNAPYGQLITYTATLSGGNSPTGTVTFQIDGMTFGTATVSNGAAVYTGTNEAWAPGTYTITAIYSGDANNSGSSATLTQAITQASSYTAVSAGSVDIRFTDDSCSACFGTSVGGGDRNLFLDSVSIGTTSLPNNSPSLTFENGCNNSGGMWCSGDTLVANSAVAGASSVTVYAHGSPDYNVYPEMQVIANGSIIGDWAVTGSSQGYTVTISPALASQYVQGQPVQLTASMVGAWGGTPTGTVTFYDGQTALGTASAQNGVANLTVSNFTAGTHTITAQYGGDGNFGSSSSNSFSLAVNAPPSVWDSGTVTLTVDGVTAATTTYGQGSTSSSVAAGLAANVAADSPVSITDSNGSLNIVSKNTGANTNYSYALQTTSWDSTDFSQPSFLNPPASGSLQGGADTITSSGTIYSYSIPSYIPGQNPTGYDAVSNIVGYSDSVNGAWGFSYDSLNRLTGAAGSIPNQPAVNKCWAYDSFGNRTLNVDVPCSQNTAALQNYNAKNQATDGSLQFDVAGDVTADALGKTYLYDAEGRICAMQYMVSGITVTRGYIYNADGERVSKGSITSWNCDPTANGFQTTTDYIIGPNGEQLTELAPDGNGMTAQRIYVYADGHLMADIDSSGAHYRLTDWLGNLRAIANQTGGIESTYMSLPFGEQLGATGSVPASHYFTGKERDSESGNDYFGTRYYAGSTGRWLSPDVINLTNARAFNPASTLNKYAYGANNPLKYIDSDGEDITIYYRPASGASGDYGHILLGVLNQVTGRVGFLDYYPAQGTNGIGQGPGVFNPGDMSERGVQNAEGQFASLTIRTTPEAAQKVIDLIEKLKNGPAPDYSALFNANNCTTMCEDVLHDLGLDFGDVLPSSFWNDAYTNFAPYAQQHPIETWMYGVPHQAGNEYGNPRYKNQSQLMFYLYWLQIHPDQDKSSVTTTETYFFDCEKHPEACR